MLVVDYSWAHPAPAAIRAAGYSGVMRYLARKVDAKLLQPVEVEQLHAAGLGIGVVWETTAARAGEGAAAGAADAWDAERLADTLGMPAECPIFYAVDSGALTADAVRPYFAAVLAGARRPVGVYGSHSVVEGLPEVPYVWQCAAWSAGRISDRAHLYQRIGHTSPARASLGSTDENRALRPLPLWLPGGVMWLNPVPGRITRAYSATPVLNPATKVKAAHLGTDVAAGVGTAIKSPAAGRVVGVRTGSWRGDSRPGLLPGRTGNGVLVEHAGGVRTYHGHCSRVLVAAGDTVAAGQVIALVGDTGMVTGPHDHLEVHPAAGSTTDPVPWLAARGVTLGADPYTAAYVREVQDLLNLANAAGLARDGDLGPKTIAAVESFQRTAGLVVDGDPGPRTLAALRTAAGQTTTPEPAPVPVPEEDPLMAVADTIEAALAQGREGERPAGWVEVLLARIATDTAAARTAAEAALAKVDALALATGITPDALAVAVRGALDGAALVLDTTPEG